MPAQTRARGRRATLIVVAGILVALGVASAWLVVRGLQAKNELEAAVSASAELGPAVTGGDLIAARQAVEALEEHSGTAASLTGDPIWRMAEAIPALGPNLAAVRVSATQVHSIAADVALPLLDLADGLRPDEASGASFVDLDALAATRQPMTVALATLASADGELSAVDRDALVPQLRDGVQTLSDLVETAVPAVQAIADAGAVLPGMLGQHDARTILITAQNNAELRTGGGITGTFIELRAEKGALTIASQADSSEFPTHKSPVLEIPESTTALYSDVVGRYVPNASMSADFDLTARLVSQWWSELGGTQPDAVISVDPVVLQAILTATGPVSTPAGALTADNLISTLLIEPYQTLSMDEQTSVFEGAAKAVFGALTTGGADPARLAAALSEPVSEGRVSVWSAHADEQAVLAETALAGPAARQRAAGSDAYAIYFNDATGGKMDTYLDTRITSGATVCRADGLSDVEISVTLTSDAPADAATSLPYSMTGGGRWGTPAGQIATIVSVSAPVGSFYGGVSVDGTAIGAVDVTDSGFPVSATKVVLSPGETKTVTFRFVSATADAAAPVILHTPMITEPTVTASAPACG